MILAGALAVVALFAWGLVELARAGRAVSTAVELGSWT